MSTVLHQSATLGTTFTSALTKEMSKPRGESGERADVPRSYSATIQNNNKYTKSNLNVISMFCFWKKDDVAQIKKIPACSDNWVSEKALLQLSVFKVLILLYKNPSYNLFRPWKK